MKRSERQILIKKLDKLVSDFVRRRDGWACVRCHTPYEPPTSALHCSHFFGRVHMGTRFDLSNLDALCYGCHRFVEGNKMLWYMDFKIKQLGQRKFNILKMKAQTVTKFSLVDLQILKKQFEGGEMT